MLTAEAHGISITTENVLQKVFEGEELRRSSSHQEDRRVYVIPQGGEPRWILVGSPREALPVLRSWAPWKLSSRVRWGAVQMAAASNSLPFIPGVENLSTKIDTSYWRASLAEFPAEWSAVIHVGSFSHTRKAILFLIENGQRVVCAAKVPLVPGAVEAIFNEGEMLDLLRRYDYLPKVVHRDRARGIVVQSWLEGQPVSRGFSQPHLDLLESLFRADGCGRVSDHRAEMQSAIAGTDLPFDRAVLARGLELLDSDTSLPRFIEHRDFAPWNLKWIRKGVLGLLDWEWATAEGLPWQDICRYFYLDDVHFRGHGRVWEALTSHELPLRYRKKFDIQPETLPALTMRYLLRELLMEWNSRNEWLADYAFRQIRALIAATAPARG